MTQKSDAQVFVRYQGHMRAITLSSGDISHTLQTLSCPNLRSLYCYSFTCAILETAYRSPLLESLTIRNFPIFNEESLGYLFNALKRLPFLKNLHLGFFNRINTGTAQRIIEASRHCESLYLAWDPFRAESYGERPKPGYGTESVKNAMDQMEGIQFRKLAIGLPSEEQESIILIPLLEKCHLLESFDLIYTRAKVTIQKITHILRSNPHRRLKSLYLGRSTPYTRNEATYDEDIISLLRVVGGQGNEGGKCAESMGERGIQTLTIDFNIFGLTVIQILPNVCQIH
ncbi:hypothetical protein BGX21_003687 [Mortierella sp. AD011]|nr:hypothetical protein BGX21_003687 [Mortierella sp. AD011]